jgi:hypothetical protein
MRQAYSNILIQLFAYSTMGVMRKTHRPKTNIFNFPKGRKHRQTKRIEWAHVIMKKSSKSIFLLFLFTIVIVSCKTDKKKLFVGKWKPTEVTGNVSESNRLGVINDNKVCELHEDGNAFVKIIGTDNIVSTGTWTYESENNTLMMELQNGKEIYTIKSVSENQFIGDRGGVLLTCTRQK